MRQKAPWLAASSDSGDAGWFESLDQVTRSITLDCLGLLTLGRSYEIAYIRERLFVHDRLLSTRDIIQQICEAAIAAAV